MGVRAGGIYIYQILYPLPETITRGFNVALTARQIETAKPKPTDYQLSDSEGMYLLVKKNGSKYWRLKYRILGKEKLLAIGVYPQVSLATARIERTKAKETIAEGSDPSANKKAAKAIARLNSENDFKPMRLNGLMFTRKIKQKATRAES